MSVSLLDNFAYNGKKPDFQRSLFQTIEDMKNFSENYLPELYQCLVVEDGNMYRYNVSNSIDPTLGKWRLVDSSSDDVYIKDEINNFLDEKVNNDDFEPIQEKVELLDNNVETEGSIRYLDNLTYKQSKTYIDSRVEALNKKKSIACDEKPTYTESSDLEVSDTITYKINGVEKTIDADEIWFYYMAENDLNGDSIISANEVGLCQTIWIDKIEFTIMSFGIDVTEYVNKVNDVVSEYTGEELDTSKIPNISALHKLEEKITSNFDSEKVGYENEAYPEQTNVKKALDSIWAKIDYVKPSILTFTMTPSTETYEVGQEITNLEFEWSYNKNIKTQSLTDVILIDETTRSGSWSGSLKTNKTFTLTCNDGQNSTTLNKIISFKNKIYYGSSATPENYDSEFILGLTNKHFATNYKGNFTIMVGGGEYGFICIPSSFNCPSECYIGGFLTELVKECSISFVNASGAIVTYDIIRTNRSGLGNISLEFK